MQDQVQNAYLVLMLQLGLSFAWCFRTHLLQLWTRAVRTAPTIPIRCQQNPLDMWCIWPFAKVVVRFGAHNRNSCNSAITQTAFQTGSVSAAITPPTLFTELSASMLGAW
jgi:hypothetical protein